MSTTNQQRSIDRLLDQQNRRTVITNLIIEHLCSEKFHQEEQDTRALHSVYLLQFYYDVWS